MGKICHQGTCKGRSQGDSCANQGDCDVGLACVKNLRPPHETTCKVPVQTGKYCTEDYECEMDHFCTYKDGNIGAAQSSFAQGIKTCEELYLISDETVFIGWDQDAAEAVTWEDMLRNGRRCSSGVAYRSSPTIYRGKCVTISEIREGGTGNVLTSPYPCNPLSGGGCEYHFTSNGVPLGLIRNSKCECSLSGSSGYCKIPGDFEMREYGQAIRFMASKSSFCHTWDRHNIISNPECTIAEYEELRESYEIIYEFRNWPFIQANSQIKECFDNFHPESQYNIRFSQRAAASGLSVFAGLAALALALVY